MPEAVSATPATSTSALKSHHAGRGWDAGAATLSVLCILHCLALPLFATLVPVLAMVSDAEWVHVMLVMLAAPVTLWVVRAALPNQESVFFVVIAVSGLALMVSAVTLAPEQLEDTLTLAGGTLLGGAHMWRWLRHQTRQAGNSAARDNNL